MTPHPAPWTPWPVMFCLKLKDAEMKRREWQGNGFDHSPTYPYDPHRVLDKIIEQSTPTAQSMAAIVTRFGGTTP
jgi:hypothetical protein